MAARTEIDIQFQAILQTIRDQGANQASALRDQGERMGTAFDGLSTEVRELTKWFVRGQSANGGGEKRNGSTGTYAAIVASIIGSLIGIMGPTWQRMGATDTRVLENRAAIQVLRDDTHSEFAEVKAELAQRAADSAANRQMLIEIETQFTGLGNHINLEFQQADRLLTLLTQCNTSGGKCELPTRDYWGVVNLGKGNGASKE